MRRHPFIKFITLTIIYSFIILSLFVLQFKTDTSITHALGDMRIILDRRDTGEEDSEIVRLKNQFSVSYRGLSFIAGDSNPVTVSSSDGKNENLILDSCSVDGTTATLVFTDGISLCFAVTGIAPYTSLSVTAISSDGFDTVSLPFYVSSSHKVIPQTANSVIVESKTDKFILEASSLTENRILLSKKAPVASFSLFIPEKRFEYTAVADSTYASDVTYEKTVSKLRNAVISQFSQVLSSSPSSITERQVLAYVAEMGAQGKFMQAVNAVPSSFKNGSGRTYLSTPYFGNLVSSNAKLVTAYSALGSAVNNAAASGNLSVFTEDFMGDYILMERKTEKVKALMQMPSKKTDFSPSLSEAAGILAVYSKVRKIDEELASSLDSVLPACLDAIADRLKLQDDGLEFINGEVSSLQKIRIGRALIDFARSRNKNEYADTGRMIIAQELSNSDSFDLDTLADIYSIVVTDNTFYPHYEILGYYGTRPVWAWTCASAITYRTARDGVVSLNLEFPLENSHYVIINGVPTFHSQIEIQKLRFRTDPKFESYNSSGYAYDEGRHTLFLKSRHKSKNELIRLFCDPVSSFTGPDDTVASLQEQVQELGLANVSVKRTDEGLMLSVQKIQFEAESATLRESEFAKLQQIAQILKAYPDNDIMVSGHTAKSSIGRPAQPLSEERAEAVAEYLVQLGVRSRDHIFTQGFGDTRPISPNDTEEERAVNRRVEITIMNK